MGCTGRIDKANRPRDYGRAFLWGIRFQRSAQFSVFRETRETGGPESRV